MSDEPDLDSAYALETPEDNLALYKTWAESYDADFVDGAEYRIQMDGLAQALRDAVVSEALVRSDARLMLVQWKGFRMKGFRLRLKTLLSRQR